jgi:hypothetical protein
MPSEIVDMIIHNWSYPYGGQGVFKYLELAEIRVEEKRRHSKSGDKAPKKEEKHKDPKDNKIKNITRPKREKQ